MLAAVDSPGKPCGVNQSLRPCVKDELVPSVNVTANVWPGRLPLTAVAGIRSEENRPAGSAGARPSSKAPGIASPAWPPGSRRAQ